MSDIKWVGQHIEVAPPKRPKKITGTRLAAIMGANKWTTEFATWCEITKTFQKPYEETPALIAGRTIEPKQAQFMRDTYMMSNLITPTDKYGRDYFKTTFGDFFHDRRVVGGMWDYLLVDKSGNPTAVLEMKTTKRAEDWVDDVPNYYALQAALYAWLLNVDQVYMVCSILRESDYDDPNAYVPSGENTFVVPFKVSERYPKFDEIITHALEWWEAHVETGISPDYDPKKDADIIKELKKVSVSPDDDMSVLLAEADDLMKRIAAHESIIAPMEQRLKVIKEAIKATAAEQLGDDKTTAVLQSPFHTWTVSRSVKTDIKYDNEKMMAEGVFDRYAKTTNKITDTLRVADRED